MLNAQDLNKLLQQYLEALLDDQVPDIRGIGDRIVEESRDYCGGEETLFVNFLSDMGSSFCYKTYSYWTYREDIQRYQLKHQISSVFDAVVSWGSDTLIYPEISNQLLMIPGDVEKVMIVKNMIVDWFISFAKECIQKDAYLLKQDSLYADFVFRHNNLEKISQIAQNYEWASLNHEPFISPVGELDHDKFLCHWWEKEYNLFLFRRNSAFENQIQEASCLTFSLVKTADSLQDLN